MGKFEDYAKLISCKRFQEVNMILIPVKQVPDSWSERELNNENSRLARDKADLVLNDLDEFAIEAALRIAEANSMPTAVVTVGPAAAKDALLKALSMGVEEAYHIDDSRLEGACFQQTSSAISAIAKKVGARLIITGLESTDGKGSVIPGMVAAHLTWPCATSVSQPELDGEMLKAQFDEPRREIKYELKLPCVISISENANDPRFPSFKGIMAAKKKAISHLKVDDLMGYGFDELLVSSSVQVESWEISPARTQGPLISDKNEGIKVITEALLSIKEA